MRVVTLCVEFDYCLDASAVSHTHTTEAWIANQLRPHAAVNMAHFIAIHHY